MKLRLGLVGLGPTWAPRHKPALRALADRFEVRAVCDPVSHRAEQAAAEFGCRAADGFRAVAAGEDVDAIALLSARWFGTLPINAACDHGKAVYCGASVDMPADDARDLRDRIRDSGIAFMAEFPNRLAPATIRLKELIATRLGQPRLLFCNQRRTADKPIASGGNGNAYSATMRHMIEMVDWCRYIIGSEATAVRSATHAAPPKTTLAHASSTNAPLIDDYSLLIVEFEAPSGPDGVAESAPFAQIACGAYVPPAWGEASAFRRPADLQVICERGIAFVDLPNTLVWFDDAGQHTESLHEDRPLGELLLLNFQRTVESLVLPHANLEDAFRALSIVIEGRRSHSEGRKVLCSSD